MPPRTPRPLLLALAVTLVAVGVLVAVLSSRGGDDVQPEPSGTPSASASTSAPSPGPTGEPSPDPTGPADPSPSPTTTPTVEPPALAVVGVTLTIAGWDPTASEAIAAGYVDAVEEGGTCTLTLTGATGEVVTAEGPATVDASTTSCGTLGVPGSSLSSGTWLAVLTYTSPISSGESVPMPIEIP